MAPWNGPKNHITALEILSAVGAGSYPPDAAHYTEIKFLYVEPGRGECLSAHIPSQYVIFQLGQLSPASIWGHKIKYRP